MINETETDNQGCGKDKVAGFKAIVNCHCVLQQDGV